MGFMKNVMTTVLNDGKKKFYTWGYAKDDARKLKEVLGNRGRVEDFFRGKEMNPSIRTSLYNELIQIVTDEEAELLSAVKDQFIFRNNNKVLWEQFKHREIERQKRINEEKINDLLAGCISLFTKISQDSKFYKLDEVDLLIKAVEEKEIDIPIENFTRYYFGYKYYLKDTIKESVLSEEPITVKLLEEGYEQYQLLKLKKKNPTNQEEVLSGIIIDKDEHKNEEKKEETEIKKPVISLAKAEIETDENEHTNQVENSSNKESINPVVNDSSEPIIVTKDQGEKDEITNDEDFINRLEQQSNNKEKPPFNEKISTQNEEPTNPEVILRGENQEEQVTEKNLEQTLEQEIVIKKVLGKEPEKEATHKREENTPETASLNQYEPEANEEEGPPNDLHIVLSGGQSEEDILAGMKPEVTKGQEALTI